MPRGHKSKLRARERRRQARDDTQGLQFTAAEEEGSLSSSPVLGATSQSSPTDGSHSTHQVPRRAPSTTTTSAGVSCRRSDEGDEGATNQDEERPRVSQPSHPTDRSRRTPLDQKAILLVQFLLRKYNMKETITKEDMLKYVIRRYKDHFDEILRRASELMLLAFGFDVKEVDTTRHCYTLISKLQCTSDGGPSAEEFMPKTGLLMTVLCVIFMKGNHATEEDIWEVLNVMGIYAGRKHFIYGEPRKLITKDLVQEKYLEYRQVPNSDPPRYEFLWGPRAHVETSKMQVLEFLAKVHETVPSAFPAWYEEALREEEERARARFAALARTNGIASA